MDISSFPVVFASIVGEQSISKPSPMPSMSTEMVIPSVWRTFPCIYVYIVAFYEKAVQLQNISLFGFVSKERQFYNRE